MKNNISKKDYTFRKTTMTIKKYALLYELLKISINKSNYFYLSKNNLIKRNVKKGEYIRYNYRKNKYIRIIYEFYVYDFRNYKRLKNI